MFLLTGHEMGSHFPCWKLSLSQ
ncbi:hypothetical protein NC653_024910 [Populus alba x Populus x berolinensis]|uniref:Uncharacterized protein n=1 Tax=Populus alba x Populus x berolinensis TaxID=444605 RepID=A0AAD6Q7E9_9ROSI|nr:hypothetical protein NC653_024910 [Populus alba x Populus x berolinensis]